MPWQCARKRPGARPEETRAKYFAYNKGMYVIHVVGPKIRTVQNALHDLSRTYVNVLDEFCKVFEGPVTTTRPASQVLRLLPVSSGIFLQNKKPLGCTRLRALGGL